MGDREDRRRRVKQAVRANFDASADAYEAFESSTRLFAHLAAHLSDRAGLEAGMRVLDVGCGTGISSEVMAGIVGGNGEVVGVDLSEAMLGRAGSRLAAVPVAADFICGDAEELSRLVEGSFDAVLFTASIFLFPDPATAVAEAAAVLRSGGSLAANVLTGAVTPAGNDLHAELERVTGRRLRRPALAEAGLGRELFAPHLGAPRIGDLWEEELRIPMEMSALRDFFLIPAQSAGLLPKLPYGERKAVLAAAFAELAAETGEPALRWRFFGGKGVRPV